jgi:general stress protein 26
MTWRQANTAVHTDDAQATAPFSAAQAVAPNLQRLRQPHAGITMQSTRQQEIEELRELVMDLDIAMFTTRDGGGHLHSRPMDTQEVDDDGHLWFLTLRKADVVGEVHAIPAICLTYGSQAKNTYLCVSGKAEEIHDQAKISELWSPMHAVYFSGGRDDPDLTLLRVTPSHAEAWTGPAGAVGKLLAFATAAITGDAEALSSKQTLPT